MSQNLAITSKIDTGTISRYIKPSFMENGKILNEAFDLREWTPPEKFVSFYKVEENDEDKNFILAIDYLSITPKKNGAIILLDIEESLEEVNDEVEDIIAFTEQDLPHCGLIYIDEKNLTKIQEAKTTLSYLASDRFRYIRDIKYERIK